mgnify:FL=1
MFQLGYIRAQTTQILAHVSAKEKPKSGILLEFGRVLLRAILPYATPYILALLSMIGAAVVAGWKAFSRGWLSW